MEPEGSWQDRQRYWRNESIQGKSKSGSSGGGCGTTVLLFIFIIAVIFLLV